MADLNKYLAEVYAERGARPLAGYLFGGIVGNKKEEKMASSEVVFNDLQTVFGLEYKNSEEFFRDLHYAAEGIRQHDALHRVEDAFAGAFDVVGFWPEDEVAKKRAGKTTTIIGGNEEEK